MKKGQVWYVTLPSTNTHEQAGKRPVTLMSKPHVNIVMATPFTTKQQANNFPHTFKVKPSKQNGLSKPSIVLAFQTRAIDKERLEKQVGKLGKTQMDKLDKQMKNLLQL